MPFSPRRLLQFIFTLICTSFVFSTYAADKPNILLILTDDQGFGDLGCYGHPTAKTPNIDRLAKQGVRFTQFYANGPECTPTRTALFTGRYQQRAGGLECAIGTGNVGRYDHAIQLANQNQLGLPVNQTVLPNALNQSGYTSAIYGKWHLGYETYFNPTQYGWSEFFGCLGGNVDYFTHKELSPLPVLFYNNQPVNKQGYMTDLITQHAENFLKTKHDKPFFLYVPYTNPHFPYQGPNDQNKPINADNWTKGDPEIYKIMLENLDLHVGKLLKQLDNLNLTQNTLVIFASDNGGTSIAHHANLRGKKSTLFEAGIRVPMIIRWPGKIKPDTTCNQVCITMDLTKSLLQLTNSKAQHPLDGYDIINHIISNKPDFPRTLYWRSKRGQRTWRAIRSGNMKYIIDKNDNLTTRYLFNLQNDISESQNLFSQNLEQAVQFEQQIRNWEVSVKPIR